MVEEKSMIDDQEMLPSSPENADPEELLLANQVEHGQTKQNGPIDGNEELGNVGENEHDVEEEKQPDERQTSRKSRSSTTSSGKMLKSMEHVVPLFKLEIMGLSTMYVMLAVMWILGLFTLAIQIVLLALFSPASNSVVGTYEDLMQAVFAIEGILRTAAAVLLVALLIAYPQRVILHWYRTYRPEEDKWFPYWHQGLIVLIILIMTITPCYSFYEAVVFWNNYYLRDDEIDVIATNDSTSTTVPLGILSLLFTSRAAVVYNTVTSMIVLAITFLYIGGIYHFQYESARAAMTSTLNVYKTPSGRGDDSDDEGNNNDAASHERQFLLFGRRKSTEISEDLEEDDEAEEVRANRKMIASAAYQRDYAMLEARTWLPRAIDKCHAQGSRCRNRYTRLTGRVPFGFQVLIVTYLIILLVFNIVFGTNPSTVPLVGLVTVIRICSMNVTDLLPRNVTTFENVTLSTASGGTIIVNATVNYQVRSYIESDELGACSPSQDIRLPFERTVASSLFAVLEIALFYYIHILEKKTRFYLRETHYAQTRRDILGFQFTKSIARVCVVVVLIGAIIAAAINPIEMYTISDGFIELIQSPNDQNNVTVNVIVDLDPMFQTGVGVGTIGFGSFFSMIILWIGLLAFAYLPYDSVGVKGWFVGKKLRKGEESYMETLHRDDFLLLVAQEDEVAQLLKIRQRELERQVAEERDAGSKTTSGPGQTTLNSKLDRSQSSRLLHVLRLGVEGRNGVEERFASNPERYSKLVQQVSTNVLVLETEILMFHFMYLSYVMGNRRYDPHSQQRLALTWEEKCALVEDSRFRLVEHIIDVDTDTHVMVFDSADRVVVAFRGSVSLTNWQTDFDSSEVICSYVQDISPDLSDIPQAVIQNAKRVASNPPKVHGGFVKAYETIREKLRDVCKRLLFNPNNISPQQEEEDPTTTNNDPRGSKAKNQVSSNNHNNESKVLFVTGHSLGGGLAILCSADLAVQLKLPPSRIAVTTWGSPKVGTFSFMCRFNRVVRSARRFCMADDLITRLPIDPVLKNLTLKGWWHCGTEILLNDTGNMLIRPTPLERFMFSRTIGSPQAHLSMMYATAMMIWVVRSQPGYDPDWWTGVVTVFYKNAHKRLKPVPKNIQQRLLASLSRSGVMYTFNNKLVRDIQVDTTPGDLEEDIAEKIVVEMLAMLRLGQKEEFGSHLRELYDLYDSARLFAKEHDAQSLKEKGSSNQKEASDVLAEESGPMALNEESEDQENSETIETAVGLMQNTSKDIV